MPEENIFESDTSTMLTTLSQNTAVAQWPDEKKKEFVTLFTSRTASARYILEATAYIIANTAQRRRFISEVHLNRIYREKSLNGGFHHFRGRSLCDDTARYSQDAKCGGRDYNELLKIAEERARRIIAELPSLKAAVDMIDAETARKIERRDKMIVEGQRLTEELDVLNDSVTLEDLDQDMTIRDFRKFTKDRDRKRKAIIAKMNELGKEGAVLEDSINKRLFKGLPGLSDAIVDAVKSHLDRSTALDETTRRVSERVQFGDSMEAMRLLELFERDEATVPEQIRDSIQAALKTLKLNRVSTKKLKAAK